MIRRRLLALILASLAGGPALASGGGAEKKKGGGPSYIQLPVTTASVRRGDGRRGVLTVESGLDIPDEKLRGHAQLSQPRLQAGYVQALQIYASGLTPGAPPNPDHLARELQRETDRVLGRAGARLLIGNILIN